MHGIWYCNQGYGAMVVSLCDAQGRNKSNISSPAEEFFKRGVLEMQHSQGIASLGSIKPSLALSTLAVFVLVYFALWKGVKSTGKVENRNIYLKVMFDEASILHIHHT